MNRRKSLLAFLMVINILNGKGQTQDISAFRTEQLEVMAEKKDAEPTDDSYELDLNAFAKHPMNLNIASAEDLMQLHVLGVLQIRNFISYRKLLGSLLSVHELQAVPGWDLETIRKLLPYIM